MCKSFDDLLEIEDKQKILMLRRDGELRYLYKEFIVDKYNSDHDFKSFSRQILVIMKASHSMRFWINLLNLTNLTIHKMLLGEISPRVAVLDKILNKLGYIREEKLYRLKRKQVSPQHILNKKNKN